MVKLTTDVLPEDKWKQMKGNLQYFYLISQDRPICFYDNEEERIAILYDSKNSELWLITKDEPHCNNFLNRLSSQSEEKDIRPGLICAAGMDLIIDEFYRANHVL